MVSVGTDRVLITGVSSFVGCHLAHTIGKTNTVFGTVQNNPSSYTGVKSLRLQYASKSCDLIQLDLLNNGQINDVISKVKPSAIIHHAGYTSGYSSEDFDFIESLKVNHGPLGQIFNSAKKQNVLKVIVTGSSMEYGSEPQGINENHLSFPATGYGLSKLNSTIHSLNLAKKYQIPTAVLRLFIPFGVLDHPKKLIPSFVRGIMSHKPIKLTDCTQKRDFLPINEVVSAYQHTLQKLSLDTSGIYNVCSGQAIPVREVLENIRSQLHYDKEIRYGEISMRPFEVPVNYGSNEKIQKAFHFAINPSLLSGVSKLIQDFRSEEFGQEPDVVRG